MAQEKMYKTWTEWAEQQGQANHTAQRLVVEVLTFIGEHLEVFPVVKVVNWHGRLDELVSMYRLGPGPQTEYFYCHGRIYYARPSLQGEHSPTAVEALKPKELLDFCTNSHTVIHLMGEVSSYRERRAAGVQ